SIHTSGREGERPIHHTKDLRVCVPSCWCPMRAAIGGDLAGSRFERSIWDGGSYPAVRCVGYDCEPRTDATSETAGSFELIHPSCHLTDDSFLTVAVMDWLLNRGGLRSILRCYF